MEYLVIVPIAVLVPKSRELLANTLCTSQFLNLLTGIIAGLDFHAKAFAAGAAEKKEEDCAQNGDQQTRTAVILIFVYHYAYLNYEFSNSSTFYGLRRALYMLMAAGPSSTTNRAGKIKSTRGNISVTGSLAAFSSAL